MNGSSKSVLLILFASILVVFSFCACGDGDDNHNNGEELGVSEYYDTWMGDMLGLIGGRTLQQIVIPGSHDAGMNKDDKHDCWMAIECNTVAQNYNTYDQLLLGSRFFDIRPQLDHYNDFGDEDWSTSHWGTADGGWVGCKGEKKSEIVGRITGFYYPPNWIQPLPNRDQELIIINVSHCTRRQDMTPYSCEPDQIYRLMDDLRVQLDLPRDDGTSRVFKCDDCNPMEMTLSEILEIGNIILLVEDGNYTTDDRAKGIFRKNGSYFHIYDEYANTDKLDEMMFDQLVKLNDQNNHSSTSLFLLSWTLTLQGGYAAICAPDSIIGMAEETRFPLFDFGQNFSSTRSKFPNILYVDAFDDTATGVAYYMNQHWTDHAVWSTETNDHQCELWQQAFQGDGNVVIYSWEPIWSSGTGGHPGAGDVMQEDGNYVIYEHPETRENALWSSGTAGHPGAIKSMQGDGNLCIYTADHSQALWCSNTAGNEGAKLSMQADGNLVIRKFIPLWDTDTSGEPYSDTYMRMQPDGNLVLYGAGAKGDTGIWSTNTSHYDGAFCVLQTDGNLVMYMPDQVPKALYLDPSSSAYADDSDTLDLKARHSYEPEGPEYWRATTVFKTGEYANGWLFSKASANSSKINYGCRINPDMTVSCIVQGDYADGGMLNSTTEVDPDRWHVLMLSWSHDTLRLFLDMRLEDTMDTSAGLPDYSNDQPLYLGSLNGQAGFFQGYISRTYIMQSGPNQDVYAEWVLDTDGSDSSAYHNNLQLQGNASIKSAM